VSDLINRVLDHWRENAAAPCTDTQIQEFEERESAIIPADMRRFFLSANGMNRSFRLGQDADGFAFWNLGDLVRSDIELQRRSPSSQAT
jgi:hypothetical protein